MMFAAGWSYVECGIRRMQRSEHLRIEKLAKHNLQWKIRAGRWSFAKKFLLHIYSRIVRYVSTWNFHNSSSLAATSANKNFTWTDCHTLETGWNIQKEQKLDFIAAHWMWIEFISPTTVLYLIVVNGPRIVGALPPLWMSNLRTWFTGDNWTIQNEFIDLETKTTMLYRSGGVIKTMKREKIDMRRWQEEREEICWISSFIWRLCSRDDFVAFEWIFFLLPVDDSDQCNEQIWIPPPR